MLERSIERKPETRALATAILVWLCALGAFGAFRWWVRVEPLNSDDLVLFESAKDAAAGDFWLLSDVPRQAGRRDPLCLSCDGGGIGHQVLRTGLLPVAVPLLRLLGPTAATYYLVPLAFQLLGAAAVWAWIRRYAGVRAAWVGFALLALLPYEIDHASRFFVDLPAAACLMWALWLLGGEASERRVARGVGAGLFLGWAYLLRENSPVLVIPSLALLAVQRERRPSIAVAVATLAGVFGLEQLAFVVKGLGVGFRSRMVADALATYTPFLPIYDLTSFAYRELPWFWNVFGRWPLGALACASLVLVLAVSAWVTVRSEHWPLRALAACGLATWAVFTYAPLRFEGGQVRAMAPIATRYLQPLFYTGFCVGVIVVARAWERRHHATWRPWARLPGWAGIAAVAMLAVAWGLTVRAETSRMEREDLPLHATLELTARVAGRAAQNAGAVGPAVAVWGPPLEIRVAQLFEAAGVTWQPASLVDLRSQLERAPDTLVLRHRSRALQAQRYMPAAERQGWRAAELELDAALWNGHRALGLASGFTLFVPGNGDCRVRELGAASTGRSIRVASRTKQRLDVVGGAAPTLDEAACSDCADELRLNLQAAKATAQAQVWARGPRGEQKLGPAQPLTPGQNFLAWVAPSRASRVWVELTLTPEESGPGRATLGAASHRRCPLPSSASAALARR